MDVFKFSVAASGNGAVNMFLQPGAYVYYRAATAGIDNPEVKVKTDQGEVCRLLPGEGYTFDKPFDSVTVENYDAVSTVTGYVIIGRGQFQANRLTGEVSVVDGGKSRTRADQAFAFGAFNAASVGNYSAVQLLNPSGSGKNAFCRLVLPNLGTAGAVGIYNRDTALTTLVGAGKSKRFGGTDGVCVIRKQQFTPSETPVIEYGMAANASTLLQLNEPFELEPGRGLMLCPPGTNIAMYGYFEWIEENM